MITEHIKYATSSGKIFSDKARAAIHEAEFLGKLKTEIELLNHIEIPDMPHDAQSVLLYNRLAGPDDMITYRTAASRTGLLNACFEMIQDDDIKKLSEHDFDIRLIDYIIETNDKEAAFRFLTGREYDVEYCTPSEGGGDCSTAQHVCLELNTSKYFP